MSLVHVCQFSARDPRVRENSDCMDIFTFACDVEMEEGVADVSICIHCGSARGRSLCG